MKNIFLIISIFVLVSQLSAKNPIVFEDFLEDVKLQTEQIRNSRSSSFTEAGKSSREYQVGDEHTFWSWALNVMPPAWWQTPSTCRAVGEHCYLFVADDQWDVHMNQADVDEIMPYLEEYTMNSTDYGAIEMDIDTFGDLPDELDNDPKVIIFYMELGSFQGSTFDGYFSSYNQVTEAEAQNMNPPGHSNECEMIYMTCYPLQPDDPIRISVLSHELQHLIHWGADINESTWVNEGCSELAMVLFGLPDPVTSFPNNPDNSLITWDQTFADYVKTMLFFTYLEEHFPSEGLISDIVSEPANSINGIQNQLIAHGYQIPFEGIFPIWTLANYLDEPALGEGQYNYEQLELPQFTHSAYISSFPASESGGVNAWAADYVKLNTDQNESLHYSVSISSDQPFSFAALCYETEDSLPYIDTIPSDGELFWLESGSFDKIILMISNNNSTDMDYSYTIETSAVSAYEGVISDPANIISAYPNPVTSSSNSVNFQTERISENLVIELYNVKGQKIKELKGRNSNKVKWNKKDKKGKKVPNGIYYYKMKNNKKKMKKMVIIQ